MTTESCPQAIQELAYHKWEQAGCPPGDGLIFWLEAEQEFLESNSAESHTDEQCCNEPLKKGETATSEKAR
jgi:hypothetical protein